MIGLIGIGVGAGVVSALLTLVVVTGSPISFLLFFLAPLPIAIAALGWNHKAGLIATATGALILGLLIHPRTAGVFIVATGLPAWWFSYLSLLGRPGAAPGAMEWYPVGRVLAWMAAATAAITIAGVALIAASYEDYVRAFGRVVGLIEELNPRLFEGAPEEVKPQLRARLGEILAAYAPPGSAALSLFVSVAIMAIAGRAVLASGRLPRPWPHLPATALPRGFVTALAVSLAVSFLDGFPGLAGRIAFGAVAAAYALQGLAVVHALTVGRGWRTPLLIAVYGAAIVLGGWPLMFAAVAGVADALFNLRPRRGLAPDA